MRTAAQLVADLRSYAAFKSCDYYAAMVFALGQNIKLVALQHDKAELEIGRIQLRGGIPVATVGLRRTGEREVDIVGDVLKDCEHNPAAGEVLQKAIGVLYREARIPRKVR